MHACAHIGQVKYGWEQEAGEQEKERERGERGERRAKRSEPASESNWQEKEKE